MSAEASVDLSAVRKFINSELLYRNDQGIEPNVNLIESGVIDSMTLLRLTVFLEEHYGIEISDEEIVPDNFSSLAAIESFVAKHTHPAAGK